MVKPRYPSKEWTIPNGGTSQAWDYIVEKYTKELEQYHNIKKYANRLDQLFEQEFNCKVLYEDGIVKLQFNSEQDKVWFILRWC